MNPRHERRIARQTPTTGYRSPELLPRFNRHARGRNQRWLPHEDVVSPTFGYGRTLDAITDTTVRVAITGLHTSEILPSKMKRNSVLVAELFPWHVIDRQVGKGTVKPHQARRARQYLEDKSTAQAAELTVNIAQISIKWGKHIQLVLASEELQQERLEVAETLKTEYGFKDLRTYATSTALSIEVGTCAQRIPYADQNNLAHEAFARLDEISPLIEEGVLLQGARVYSRIGDLCLAA